MTSQVEEAPLEVSDTCASCWAGFGEDIGDAVTDSFEYNEGPDSPWKKSPYCIVCFNHIKSTQFDKYKTGVEKADCVAALRRYVIEGPPINVRDKKAYPCNNISGEIYQYKYKDVVYSAKLDNSVEGEERMKWWNDMKNTLAQMELLDNPNKSNTTDITATLSATVTPNTQQLDEYCRRIKETNEAKKKMDEETLAKIKMQKALKKKNKRLGL